MYRVISTLSFLVLPFAAAVPGLASENNTIRICHEPRGNPENRKTITIDRSALQSHLDHGDIANPCYKLVLEEHFNGDSLNTELWNYDLGAGGWGNNELQEYTTENVSVSDGILRIEGRENNGAYTSGRITTKGKYDFTYGRVEVRAKIPAGQGIWPAIWLLHSDNSTYGLWPASGEIDIAEGFNYGVDGKKSVYNATHSGMPEGSQETTFVTVSENPIEDADEAFHKYAVEWEKGEIRFYVDDKHVHTQVSENWFSYYPANPNGLFDPWGPYTLGAEDAPFNQPFHLIINFAIGGDAVGAPDETTVFPQTFEIDYVKFYTCPESEDGVGCGDIDQSAEVTPPYRAYPGELGLPSIQRLDLYVDGPEAIAVDVGQQTASNNLYTWIPFNGGATVISDDNFTDPDNAQNKVWKIKIEGGVANVALTGEDLSANPILKSGFDFHEGIPNAGELVFDMKVLSKSEGSTLSILMDSGFPNGGIVHIPDSELAFNQWKTYSIKFKDLLANSPPFWFGGTGLDLWKVLTPFIFEVNGDVEALVDNIRVTNTCFVVGSCSADLRYKTPDQTIFDDAIGEPWDLGLVASDSGTEWVDYYNGASANKVNFSVGPDEDISRGNIINVAFNDSSENGVFFIQSSDPVNMRSYDEGALVFDIIADYGTNNDAGMLVKIDCGSEFCTSGEIDLGRVGSGSWQTVKVPLALVGNGLSLGIVDTPIVIFPTFDKQSGVNFRLDNIRWEADFTLEDLALPVSFDSLATEYKFVDFEGTLTSLAQDPLNSSNKVAQTTKGPGGQCFAGTILDGGSGSLSFKSAIGFKDGKTSISVDVLSPKPNVNVRLKVENADVSIFDEVDVATTKVGEWETLTFQFSPTVLSTDMTRVIVFFDFCEIGDGSIYNWDNVKLVENPAAEEPLVGAPIPTQPQSDVISMFSDTYTNVPVDTWRTAWSNATLQDVFVVDNPTKKYTGLGFVGIETVANQLDITDMDYIHLDVWSPNFTTFKIKLVDFGPDGGFGGGDDTEHEVSIDAPTQGQWVSLNIPLTGFIDLDNRENIALLILSGEPFGNISVFVDNVYFWKAATSLASPEGIWKLAPEPGSLRVGPFPGSGDWFSASVADVSDRACQYDDKYIFGNDGSFSLNFVDGQTFLEAWQIGTFTCGAPIAPHDGSIPATYAFDSNTGSLTLNGTGAYLGLAKVNNDGELPGVSVPSSITYSITFADSNNTMIVQIEAGSGVFWTFKLIRTD